jgi:beta-aspartyl-peptidase (threonine type)
VSWTLAVHGGAGDIHADRLAPDERAARHAGLQAALRAGAAVLAAGGPAVEAALAAVDVLEDDPTFNAGRGAVLDADGRVRLDAAVMDGRDRACGAVGAVAGVRHAGRLAAHVMRHTPHVLLVGEGARRLAGAAGLSCPPAAWFRTPRREADLQAALAAGRVSLDHDGGGTVGAVARDGGGHLAAVTSTGGMTAKLAGRVGDTPVIGAGTWACDTTCAVSATGHGERFIQAHVAGRVADLVELAGLSVEVAAARVVHEELPRWRGKGGLIAVGRTGAPVLPFNSRGMLRGAAGCGLPAWSALAGAETLRAFAL